MCPLAIAVDRGGYFLRVVVVRPGKLVMKFFFNALSNVDNAGENKAAWAKATNSAGVAEPMVVATCSCGTGVVMSVGAELLGIVKCQSRVSGVRLP